MYMYLKKILTLEMTVKAILQKGRPLLLCKIPYMLIWNSSFSMEHHLFNIHIPTYQSLSSLLSFCSQMSWDFIFNDC